jgi:hypothetical protein
MLRFRRFHDVDDFAATAAGRLDLARLEPGQRPICVTDSFGAALAYARAATHSTLIFPCQGRADQPCLEPRHFILFAAGCRYCTRAND